jgi:hypothetical protein
MASASPRRNIARFAGQRSLPPVQVAGFPFLLGIGDIVCELCGANVRGTNTSKRGEIIRKLVPLYWQLSALWARRGALVNTGIGQQARISGNNRQPQLQRVGRNNKLWQLIVAERVRITEELKPG